MTAKQLEAIEQLKRNVNEMMSQERFKEAVPLIEEILSIDPGDRTASRYLVLARQRMVEPFCVQADDAYVQGDYQKAIGEWKRILEMNPGDIRAEKMIELTRNLMQDGMVGSLYESAGVFLSKQEYASAIEELEKILAIGPDESRARELLLSAKQMLTNSELKALYDKAEGYMAAREYDLAIEMWEKALEIDSGQEEASMRIAMARRARLDDMYAEAGRYYRDGQYISSRELYNRIMAENPTDKDIKEIITRLNAVIKIASKIEGEDESMMMLKLAMANYISLTGNIKAAIAASWYATQLEPSSKLAYSVRGFLEREYPTIVVTLEPPVRDMNLKDQYLFAALNHIYEGRYDLAIQESMIVLELDPKNILAYKRLGSAFYAMDRKDKAREVWEKALKEYPDDAELAQSLRLFYKK